MKNNIIWSNSKRKVRDLKSFPNNPRQATKKQYQDLEKSLDNFNIADPLIINTDNTVIGGNFRLKILKAKDIKEVDVRIPSRLLTEKEADELNLRLNKNLGDWDFDILANWDEELLVDVGFDKIELGKAFPLDDDANDKIPESSKEAVSKTGDIYRLGRHKIFCGDSINVDNINKLIGNSRADMIFNDPPYHQYLDTDFSSMVGFARGNKYNAIKGDKDDFDPKFITTTFDIFGYCKEICMWGADYYAELIPDRNKGNFFVWDKTESGISPNSAYDKMFGNNFELCWSKAKHKRAIIPILWKGIFGLSKEPEHKRQHPSQKPILLCEWFINKFSDKDNLIVDLFLGSGSTLIACEKTNRICYGMEIDPIYVDVIIKRWEDYTGQKAKKLK